MSSLSAIETLHSFTSKSEHPLTKDRRTSKRFTAIMAGEATNPTGSSLLSSIEEKQKIGLAHAEVVQHCKRSNSITCSVPFTEYIVGFHLDNHQEILHQGFIDNRDEILVSSSLRAITTISTALNQLLNVPMLVSKNSPEKSYVQKIWNYNSKRSFPNFPSNYCTGKHRFTLDLLKQFEKKKESAIVVSLLLDELESVAARLENLGIFHVLISSKQTDGYKNFTENFCKKKYDNQFVVILITYGLAMSLNLQFCSKLIFLAPSWNDLNVKQAAGRIIR